jgi:hypothetical protein
MKKKENVVSIVLTKVTEPIVEIIAQHIKPT